MAKERRDSLKIFWQRRRRDTADSGRKTPFHPRDILKPGKARFNWIPTLDLRVLWHRSYFVWGLMLTAGLCVAAALVYARAFSPADLSAPHTAVAGKSPIALEPAGGVCLNCHAVGASRTQQCISCHTTAFFEPSLSAKHSSAGLNCISCHQEHRGAGFRPAANAVVRCMQCHNGIYQFHGKSLKIPHGGTVGFPVKKGVWIWKGLSDVRLKKLEFPIDTALSPKQQFHLLHIAANTKCTQCHPVGNPESLKFSHVSQNGCVRCHQIDVTGKQQPNCTSCHLEHGMHKQILASLRPPTAIFSADSKGWFMKGSGASWTGWISMMLAFPLTAIILGFFIMRRRRTVLMETPAAPGTLEHPAIRAIEEGPVYPHPVIDPKLCIGCYACVEACPHDVLEIIQGIAVAVTLEDCMEDTGCQAECPTTPKACIVMNTTKKIPPRKIPFRTQDYKTNVPGIYLIGDVSGVPLIKNAVHEGAAVARNLASAKRSNPQEDIYDVAVIGAGPAGLSAAMEARAGNLRTLVIEQGKLFNTLQNYPAGKYVFLKPETMKVAGPLPALQAGEVKEQLLKRWIHLVENQKVEVKDQQICVNLIRENERFLITTESSIHGERTSYNAANIVLAIGNHGMPLKLGVPGEDLRLQNTSQPRVKYRLYNPDDYSRQQCLVVGGGNSAVEAAVALCGLKRDGEVVSFTRSNEVTLVIRSDFKGNLKLSNKIDVYDCIDSGKIAAHFRTEVKEIREDSIVLMDSRTREVTTTIPNDLVFVFIGGEKPLRFLESLGIQIQDE